MGASPANDGAAAARDAARDADARGLIRLIAGRADDTGAWTVSSEEVARVLGIEPVRFWRAVHGVRDRICFSDAIDGWNQDTVGDLVTVLEKMPGGDPEAEMSRAGLFIPYTLGIELSEELLFRAQRFSAGHDIQADDLAAMVRHAGSVRGAIGIYCDTYVDLDALVEGCAESFRVLQGMPLTGQATAARYLRTLLARHVLDRESLFLGLRERLRLAAAQRGFTDPEERPRAAGGRHAAGAGGTGRHGAESRAEWARAVMGFGEGGIAAEDLRARYRALMMRHHPDADPRGLERCKDINVAYTLLISEVTAP
jgi:hypothetical protein